MSLYVVTYRYIPLQILEAQAAQLEADNERGASLIGHNLGRVRRRSVSSLNTTARRRGQRQPVWQVLYFVLAASSLTYTAGVSSW